MKKVLISMSDDLNFRMKAIIPARQRSKIISFLLEKEIKRREQALSKCAAEVEKDDALSKEMEDWDMTAGDGLDDGTW